MAANACTRLTLILFSIILLVLFLAISGLGIYAAVTVKTLSTAAIGFIAAGVLGVIFSVFGILGGQYTSEGKPRYICCLLMFYIFMMIFCVIFVLLAVCCFCFKPAVQFLLTQSLDQLKTLLGSLTTEQLNKISQIVSTASNALTIVGSVCIAIAVITLLTILAGSVHMGRQKFQKFYIITGSLLLLVVGAFVAVVSAMVVAMPSKLPMLNSKTVFIVLLTLGIVMFLISVMGFVSSCCCNNKSRVVLCIYIVGVFVLILGFVTILVVCFVIKGNLKSTVSEYCSTNNCTAMLETLKHHLCDTLPDAEKTTCRESKTLDDIYDLIRNTYNGVVNLVIAVAAVLTVLLVLIIVASCMACKQEKTARRDNITTDMPDYRQHKDIAY